MSTLIAFLLVGLCTEAYGHGGYYSPYRGYTRYGGYRRYSYGADTNSLSGRASRLFTATGTVPDKLERLPDQLLHIQFGPLSVTPNMTVDISQMQRRPRLYWEAEPNTLYTVLIEDVDVLETIGQGGTGKHWLVTNIPGTNVAAGDEVGDYLQSFFFANAEGGLDVQGTRDQRHIIMVYKQTRRIESGELESFSGCDSVLKRISPDHRVLFQGLGLEGPIAANFYRVGYESGWSEFFVCYVKRCTGLSLIETAKIPEENPLRLCLVED